MTQIGHGAYKLMPLGGHLVHRTDTNPQRAVKFVRVPKFSPVAAPLVLPVRTAAEVLTQGRTHGGGARGPALLGTLKNTIFSRFLP